MRRSLARVAARTTRATTVAVSSSFAACLLATARRGLGAAAASNNRRRITTMMAAAAVPAAGAAPAAAMSTATKAVAAGGDDSVLIAVGQLNSSADIDANVTAAESLAARAAARFAKMLFLPECFAFLGPSPQHSIAMAQSLDGELMGRYRAIAKRHNLWLSLGGFQTRMSAAEVAREKQLQSSGAAPAVSAALAAQHAALNPSGERIYNAHVVVDSTGAVAARYDKIHLFDVNIIGGPSLCESAFTAAGTELVTCDSPAGKLGLSVCYDLRFPELYGALSRAGAQVLTVPAAFTAPTGVAHWTALLRARAIENQCYVVAAAQTGKHNTTIPAASPLQKNVVVAGAGAGAAADGKEKAAPTPRETYGHACVIDPWGAVVAEASEGVGLAFAEISLSRIAKVRASIPVTAHRRADRYTQKPVDAPNSASASKL